MDKAEHRQRHRAGIAQCMRIETMPVEGSRIWTGGFSERRLQYRGAGVHCWKPMPHLPMSSKIQTRRYDGGKERDLVKACLKGQWAGMFLGTLIVLGH